VIPALDPQNDPDSHAVTRLLRERRLVVAAAAARSVAHLKKSVAERIAHRLQVEKTRRALRTVGIPMMSSQSHIIPVPVGDPVLCREASTPLSV
jgi:7-keto-8-aminopelargonate synthetase-like enzyme